MAIQNRRGIYSSGFDPTKLVPGEFAVVQSGDPDSDEGYSLYMCFTSGNVQRIALTEEVSGAGGSTVSWAPSLQSGTTIGTLTIDGTAYTIYAPSGGGGATDSDGVTNSSSVTGATVTAALNTLSGEIANKGTYSKPSGGIPKTDLASAVQTSLGKADTALQTAPVTSVNGSTGAVVIGNATTSAAGLMSATDKSHLDTVYADYSSALTALGV